MKHVRRELMVLAVVVSFFASIIFIPAGAAAAELDVEEFFTDVEDIEGQPFEAAAYWLGHAGIFVGDAENRLLPNELFTRSQMATVLARMVDEEDAAEEMADAATEWIDDDEIADWARGYMALAEERGWFVGDPDGSVRPEDSLSFAEIAALLARITDNGHLAEGEWPDAAMEAADTLGLFDVVEAVDAGAAIARGDMVSATWAALRSDRFIDHPEEEVADSLLLVNFEDTHALWWDTLKEIPARFAFAVTEREGTVFFTISDIVDEFGEPIAFDDLEEHGFDAEASKVTFLAGDEPLTLTFADLDLVIGSAGHAGLSFPDWPFEVDEGLMKLADLDLSEPDVEMEVTLVGTEWTVRRTFAFPEDVRENLVDQYTSDPAEAAVIFEDFMNIIMYYPLRNQFDVDAFTLEVEGKTLVIELAELLPPPGHDEEHKLNWLEFWLDTEAGDQFAGFDEVTVSYTAADAAEGKELVSYLFLLPVQDFTLTTIAPPPPPDDALIGATVEDNELALIGEAGAAEPGATIRVYEAPDGPGPPGQLFGEVTAEEDGSFTFVDEDDAHEAGNSYLVSQVIDEVESRHVSVDAE